MIERTFSKEINDQLIEVNVEQDEICYECNECDLRVKWPNKSLLPESHMAKQELRSYISQIGYPKMIEERCDKHNIHEARIIR